MLITLIYASDSCIEAGSLAFEQEIEKLRTSAAAYNTKYDITGFLFYFESRFLQVLEGEFDYVTALFSRIKRDFRHKNIRLCYLSETSDRAFEDWALDCSMAFVALNHAELNIKLRFLNRFIAETTPQPIMLKDLLVSVANELKKRKDFPRPASPVFRPHLRSVN